MTSINKLCPYCEGNCYNNHEHACNRFLSNIVRLLDQELLEEELLKVIAQLKGNQ